MTLTPCTQGRCHAAREYELSSVSATTSERRRLAWVAGRGLAHPDVGFRHALGDECLAHSVRTFPRAGHSNTRSALPRRAYTLRELLLIRIAECATSTVEVDRGAWQLPLFDHCGACLHGLALAAEAVPAPKAFLCATSSMALRQLRT
jgi:hypothetical protein